MATLSAMSDRLRSEIGDLAKSFVYQTTADGISTRYLLPYSPLDGYNLLVTKNGVDVSTTVEVEEATGYVIFDDAPEDGALLVFAGNYYRYFTNDEIKQFVTTALGQHTANHTDPYGRSVGIDTLPGLEEYPVVVHAATLALYTLATDAAFDIDITAPDGVVIPRSERFRQLMQMVMDRQEQYKTLCSQLGIGMYKIDVFTFRRISKTTNRYVPVYLPQEVDDRSMPQRAHLPMPTYGSATVLSPVIQKDLYVYGGDAYSFKVILDFEVDTYTPKSQIRLLPGGTLITEFAISMPELGSADGPGLRTLQLDLTGEQTRELPELCYYDIQLTGLDNVTHTYVSGRIFRTTEVTE